MIFATLLSLAIYGIVNQLIEWGGTNYSWYTKKVKFATMVFIAIVSVFILWRQMRVSNEMKIKRRQKNKQLFKGIKTHLATAQQAAT